MVAETRNLRLITQILSNLEADSTESNGKVQSTEGLITQFRTFTIASSTVNITKRKRERSISTVKRMEDGKFEQTFIDLLHQCHSRN